MKIKFSHEIEGKITEKGLEESLFIVGTMGRYSCGYIIHENEVNMSSIRNAHKKMEQQLKRHVHENKEN